MTNQEITIQDFLEQEKYQSVIEFVENILISEEDNNSLKIYLAIAYLCLEEIETYRSILLNLVLNSSEEELIIIAENIFNMADVQVKQENFDLAIILYQEGLEINPQCNSAYINLAQLFTQQGDFDSAICLWQELILQQPNLIISYEELGLLWQNIHEYNRSIEIYQQGLNIEANNLKILTNLAYSCLKNNQTDLAQIYLEKIIINDPNNQEALGELGYIYILENKLDLGITLWQKILNDDFCEQYISWYNNLENKSENLTININLIKALKNKLDRGEIALYLGHLFFEQKQYFLSINYYQIALENNVKDDSLYYHLILSLCYTQQSSNCHELISNYLNILDSINPEKSQAIINIFNKNSSLKLIENSTNIPKNYYIKTADWVRETSNINTNYREFDLDNILRLKPPQNNRNNLHPSFYFPSSIELSKPFIVNIENGRFYLREDEGSSAVITPENWLIGDISPESPALSPNHPDSHPSKNSIFQTKFLPPIQQIKGNVMVLAGLLNNIYFHWLFDILPRFKLLELANINVADIDYFLIDNRTNFQRETLTIFGIPPEKILPLSFPLHIQATNLIVPSFPGSIAWMPSWSCEYLREKILGNQTIVNNPHKKIYISRDRSSNRRLINEKEVINLLLKYEFEIVNLELLTVRQQAELLSQAKIVISPHGSGLSNLVFCPPKTKVIEIFAPNYVYPCYWLVSNLVDLDYYYLTGEIIGSKHFHQLLYPDSRFEDIYLNCDDLKQLLTILCN
ncbi:glycosyltransferase 61 family protein [Geminocystis sp. CENA526]|uniref:glycosyltransferase 61 family protein n=1 Tax=Geminocystis sp. CENA526 TaxID=1355871 RepID=UPI003D6F5BB4